MSESEEWLRRVVEASGTGTWSMELKSNQVVMDPRALMLLGLAEGLALTPAAALEAVHADDRVRVGHVLAAARGGENAGGFVVSHRVANGGRWVEARGQVLFEADGRAAGIVGTMVEVTERITAQAAATRTARHHALTAQLGVALTRATALRQMLQQCAEAIVVHLDAAFARVWLLDPRQNVLELEASAGLYTHLDGPHGRVPVGQLKIGLIAAEKLPHLTNAVLDDPRVGDLEWARREGMVSFAGYPLLVGDTVLGVVALFARKRLPQDTLDVLKHTADTLALGVERMRAEAELKATVRFSEMFIGILGHDLRNPLSAIATAAALLEQRTDSEKVATPVRRILVSTDRMERMISQLLDFTRIRLGRGFQLQRTRVDLAEIAQGIIEALEPVQQNEIILESISDTFGEWDSDRLSQLLSNLVANACQHGAKGTNVMIQLDGVAAQTLHLEVRNQGVIPPEVLPFVLEPLHQSAEGYERRAGSSGLGLGLFISEQIVLAHGGKISVESSAQRGTCFTVDLPRH